MRRPFLLFCLGCFFAAPAAAQEAAEPYLIPQTVFVGDFGRLVYPLKDAGPPGENLVLDTPKDLPRTKDLVITRIELDRRGGDARLLIDFQAFAPGIIPLPPVEIAARSFTGLEVRVMSILESGGALVLSPPAPPLAVPGTVPVIYGAVFAATVLILGAVFGGLWCGNHLDYLRTRRLRRRALRNMGRTLRRLRFALGRNKTGEGEALTLVSLEFRNFLSRLSGVNCRAMVPGEFPGLSSLFSPEEGKVPPGTGEFLRDLFRRCDTLRFSGGLIDRGMTLGVIEDMGDFVSTLEKAEKQRSPVSRGLSGGGVPAGGRLSGGGLASAGNGGLSSTGDGGLR
jgi:hypothetical protein